MLRIKMPGARLFFFFFFDAWMLEKENRVVLDSDFGAQFEWDLIPVSKVLCIIQHGILRLGGGYARRGSPMNIDRYRRKLMQCA